MELDQPSKLEMKHKPVEEEKKSKSKALSYNPPLNLIQVLFPQRLWKQRGKNSLQNEEREKEDKEIPMESHSSQVPTSHIPYPQKLKKGKLKKQLSSFLISSRNFT